MWDGGASSCGFHHGVTEINWQEMVTMSKVRESLAENCNSCPGRQTTSRTQRWKVPKSSLSQSHPGLAQTDSCPSELRSSVPESCCFRGRSHYEAFPKWYAHPQHFPRGQLCWPLHSTDPRRVNSIKLRKKMFFKHNKCVWTLVSLFLKQYGIATTEIAFTDCSALYVI